jgi:hypothetical protein
MNLESCAPPVHRAIFGQTVLVSSSFVNHYDEAAILLCSIPHICLIGADGEQPIWVWHEVIGDPTYADAIFDRLLHNAQRLDLTGDSQRRTNPSPLA